MKKLQKGAEKIKEIEFSIRAEQEENCFTDWR